MSQLFRLEIKRYYIECDTGCNGRYYYDKKYIDSDAIFSTLEELPQKFKKFCYESEDLKAFKKRDSFTPVYYFYKKTYHLKPGDSPYYDFEKEEDVAALKSEILELQDDENIRYEIGEITLVPDPELSCKIMDIKDELEQIYEPIAKELKAKIFDKDIEDFLKLKREKEKEKESDQYKEYLRLKKMFEKG
jgi:hypothetical protein